MQYIKLRFSVCILNIPLLGRVYQFSFYLSLCFYLT